MSHYTHLKTRIVSAPHLVQALAALGCKSVENHARSVAMTDFCGTTTAEAEVVVRAGNGGGNAYDFGFARDRDGCFQMKVTDEDRERFGQRWLARLHQQYARAVARDVLAEQGFELAGETTGEDRSLRLTLRRMD